MRKFVTIVAVLSILTFRLYSQNRLIKGRIIDNRDLDGLPSAIIKINDTVEIGRTDLNGFFEIVIPVSVNRLFLRSVGIEPTNIELLDNCDQVEVIMMISCTYDFRTLKEADRLRKKEFKKLTELHKKAFEKGVFKSDNVCYKQEFTPYFKRDSN